MTTNPTFHANTTIKSIEIGTSGKTIRVPDGWDAFTYKGMRYVRSVVDGQFICTGAAQYDTPKSHPACDNYPRK